MNWNKIRTFIMGHPFLCLYLLFLGAMMSIHPIRDDQFFADIKIQTIYDFWGVWSSRIMNWEPRPISVFLVLVFTHIRLVFFKVVTSGVLTFMAKEICGIFEMKSPREAFAVGACIWLLPLTLFFSAGWQTTIIYYLYPIAFGCVFLNEFKKLLSDGALSKHGWGLMLVSLIIALDNEGMVVFLGGLLLYGAYVYFSKSYKIKSLMIVFFFAALPVGFKLFISPANAKRTSSEITTWFSSYLVYGGVEKLYHGFIAAWEPLVLHVQPYYFVFAILIYLGVASRYKYSFFRILAILPFLCMAMQATGMIPFLVAYPNSIVGIPSAGFIQTTNVFSLRPYISFTVYALSFYSCVVSLWLIFRDSRYAVCAPLMLIFGFCSKWIMSFSPTIYASGERTGAVFAFSMMLLSIMIVRFMLQQSVYRNFCMAIAQWKNVFLPLAYGSAFFLYLGWLLKV